MRLFCLLCCEPITIPDQAAGQAVTCPSCHRRFQAPNPFGVVPRKRRDMLLKDIWKAIADRWNRMKMLNPPENGVEGEADYELRLKHSIITFCLWLIVPILAILIRFSGYESDFVALLYITTQWIVAVLFMINLFRDHEILKRIEAAEKQSAEQKAKHRVDESAKLQPQHDTLLAFYGENKDLLTHAIPPLCFQAMLRVYYYDFQQLQSFEYLLRAIRSQSQLRRLYAKYRPVIEDAYSEAVFEERLATLVCFAESSEGDPSCPPKAKGGSKRLERELTDLHDRMKAAADAQKEPKAEPTAPADIEAQIRDINASDYSDELKAIQIDHLKNKQLEATS